MEPLFPFEPIRTIVPPSGGQWAAQIKWDGVRMLLYYDGSETRLFNRKKNERTLQYPELLDTANFCRADSVILDGEIIAFDQSKPSFHEVMRRDSLRSAQSIKYRVTQVPVTYMIFDVLVHNGKWMTDESLANRQLLLKEIIAPRSNVQLVENFADGLALFELMRQHRMEGVIYKDLSSSYSLDGKDGRWRKMKVMNDLYAVVGGVTFRHNTVNALLLGVYASGGELIYIGHAGTGKLTQSDWTAITEKMKGLMTSERPFANEPERAKDAHWVTPSMVVKVEYLELTPSGTMRQPSIQAVVDMGKSQCTFDQLG